MRALLLLSLAALFCGAAEKPKKAKPPSEFEQTQARIVGQIRAVREGLRSKLPSDDVYEDGFFATLLTALFEFEAAVESEVGHQTRMWRIAATPGSSGYINATYNLKLAVISERDELRRLMGPGCKSAHKNYDDKPASELSRNQTKILNLCEVFGQ